MSSQNKNEGKPRLGLVLKDFSNAIEALARLRENNLKKYARDNWSESIGTPDEPRFLEENLESIERHVGELWKGNALDPENGDHHATAIMCRVSFILEYYYRQKAQREIDLASLQMIEYGDETKNRLTGEPIEAKKTIYDWSKIDKKYNWAATDLGGDIYAYAIKPEIHAIDPRWFSSIGDKLVEHKIEQCDDWEDSLEARPT